MKTDLLHINKELLIAALTWLLVAVSALGLAATHPSVTTGQWWLAVLAYAGFALGFLSGTRDKVYQHDRQVRVVLVLWQFACVLALYILLPYSYNAILMTMLSGQVVYYVTLHRAILLSPLWSVPLWLTLQYIWDQPMAWLTALLFWTFNVFAMMMIDSRRREELARQSAEAANRELTAAQAMLQRATREQERTRIARNIHDLLGHHLTALSIHLQVASRQAGALSQESTALSRNLDRCHTIARLLLQDVREAVSDMRDSESVSLREAISVLTRDVPGLKVNVDTQEALPELSFSQAHAIIKAIQECITNTLRHAAASELTITISHSVDRVKLVVKDNGEVDGSLIEGNGLTGMRERLREVQGSVLFERTPALMTTIEVPVKL